ncbi:MAG: S8 family serine peptidase [Pirellulales bacterium]
MKRSQRGSMRGRRQSCRFESLEERRVLAAFVDGEILVQFADTADDAARAAARDAVRGRSHEELRPRSAAGGSLERVVLQKGVAVNQAIAALANRPGVLFAEPNWILTASAVSNDPDYTRGALWGMYGDDAGTAVGPTNTTSIFGSQAEKAWDAGFTGSKSVVVGIVDEGFDITHPDLAANVWVNPFEQQDGIDNDGNGYVDDVNGWDFVNNNNTVYDGSEDDHGTHVAGTIAGVGGNGIGVAGVSWNTTLISTKFLGPSGGTTANAVKALDYLTDLKLRHGIDIVASNNSWGGGGYSSALHTAIIRGANAGILFVAAAGNGGTDGVGDNNDSVANYPSNYTTLQGTTSIAAASYESVIAVAALTSAGTLASYSNYGASTVDIGAPGSGIYSTLPGGTYGTYSGTSMATPHVTGAVALYAAAFPDASALQVRNAVLGSARATSSLSGKSVTGGRLDVGALVQAVPVTPPTLSIGSVSAKENVGTFTFTVTLSAASTSRVTVKFATANGTAKAGRSGDYLATSGTLTFNPGETAKTIVVSVVNDKTIEPDETFFMNLSGATGATIAGSQGTGTIVNDDGITTATAAAFASVYNASLAADSTDPRRPKR